MLRKKTFYLKEKYFIRLTEQKLWVVPGFSMQIKTEV